MTTSTAPTVPMLANVITLGVRDLTKMRDFYRAFGWPLVVEMEDFYAFELRGAVLALFPIDRLAEDGQSTPASPMPGIRFALGIIVERPEEVDAAIAVVRAAGGRVTKPPMDATAFSGRDAYFADPEDNYWEIAWAPPGNGIVDAARRAARVDG